MDKIRGEAGKLTSLVEYQAGAVVSKEIVGKDKGTATIFAFDKGQGLSEHTAPFDAVAYIFDGKADIVISGKTHQMSAGEIIIMPANKSHSLKAPTPFKMLLIMIRA